MTSRCVLLGADGMLAVCLRDLVRRRGDDRQWTHLTRADLDITQRDRMHAMLDDLAPKWVINATGFTNVDGAESAQDAAFALNAQAVGDLAAACAARSITLLHYSTDYVFNGDSDRPWRENDPTGPVNVYGRSKLAGEQALRASGTEHLIIRSSWLYAAHGRNFVRTIASRLKSDGQVRVIDDQHGRPTSCDDLAAMSLELMNTSFRGTIHAANSGEATWYEFACAIRDQVAPDALVDPCPTSAYPTPAARPRCSTLDLSWLISTLGTPPRHWREALHDVLTALATRT